MKIMHNKIPAIHQQREFTNFKLIITLKEQSRNQYQLTVTISAVIEIAVVAISTTAIISCTIGALVILITAHVSVLIIIAVLSGALIACI